MSGSSSRFDLQGSVAVVLGATGTLGGAIARGLAQHGASVGVAGRNPDRGESCAARIRAEGHSAEFLRVDSSEVDQLRSARARVEDTLGACDVLVNCVGGNDARASVSEERRVSDVSLDAWRGGFALNVEAGALLPCQVFGEAMVPRGRGSIVNVASVAAHVPVSRGIAYSASKAAVLNLTRFLAREWAHSGVRVNSITPGFFLADQNRDLLQHEDGSPTDRARQILDRTPMGRLGEPDELVGAAVFLASSAASRFVTGADIRIDGGFLATSV